MQNSNKKEHPTDADALFLWKVLSAGEPLTSTLVTLDTVVLVPSRNEGLHTALLVSSGTNLPRTVNSAVLYEIADLQQVTGLSVDRTNELLNECGSVILLLSIVR